MVYPINFYGCKLNKDDEKVMEKMGEFLEKLSGKEVHVFPVDVTLYENIFVHDNGIMFGEKVDRYVEGLCRWRLPDIKKLHSNGDKGSRKFAMSVLGDVAEEIKNHKENAEQESYVEKDGVKFGQLQDIELTEKEAEHLKTIRDLLGGGKIVIKKGDITVEVEQ